MRDEESGNDYTGVRSYSSQSARWLSTDPVSGSLTLPQSLNRFGYVLNDPINLWDPDGREWRATCVSIESREGLLSMMYLLISLLPFFAAFALGSSEDKDLYVESWKQGPTRIKERIFMDRLSCADVLVRRLEAENASKRFKLVVKLADGKVADCRKRGTLGWIVQLFESGSEQPEDNLLKPTKDPYQDYFRAEDLPGYFLAGTESVQEGSDAPALFARRVVKVEQFYAILKCEKVEYASTGLLEACTLHMTFTNDHSPSRVHREESEKAL